MPSHLKPADERPSDVTPRDLIGNEFADTHAKIIAKARCIDLNVSSNVVYHHNLVRRIQRRHATIIMNLPYRAVDKEVKIKPEVHETTIDDLINASEHVAFRQTSCRVACARCRQSYNEKDKACPLFLRSHCSGLGNVADRPVPLPYEALHIGNKSIHHTHCINSYKGIMYCNKCGTRGPTKLIKLSMPCQPPTQYGIDTLRALRRGCKPPGIVEWPEDSTGYRSTSATASATIGTRRRRVRDWRSQSITQGNSEPIGLPSNGPQIF